MTDNAEATRPTPDEIRATVKRLSAAAFDLAKAAAANGGSSDRQRESARQLDRQLDELWPAVDALPSDEKAEANAALTDARLDLDYVFSAGQLPTSTRMFHYLQELRRG